jgi:hypothetical protein
MTYHGYVHKVIMAARLRMTKLGNETNTFSKKRERDSISVSKSVCFSRHMEGYLPLIKMMQPR